MAAIWPGRVAFGESEECFYADIIVPDPGGDRGYAVVSGHLRGPGLGSQRPEIAGVVLAALAGVPARVATDSKAVIKVFERIREK
eukprot:12202225-Alexandrium_andersonii.AAC.1